MTRRRFDDDNIDQFCLFTLRLKNSKTFPTSCEQNIVSCMCIINFFLSASSWNWRRKRKKIMKFFVKSSLQAVKNTQQIRKRSMWEVLPYYLTNSWLENVYKKVSGLFTTTITTTTPPKQKPWFELCVSNKKSRFFFAFFSFFCWSAGFFFLMT